MEGMKQEVGVKRRMNRRRRCEGRHAHTHTHKHTAVGGEKHPKGGRSFVRPLEAGEQLTGGEGALETAKGNEMAVSACSAERVQEGKEGSA